MGRHDDSTSQFLLETPDLFFEPGQHNNSTTTANIMNISVLTDEEGPEWIIIPILFGLIFFIGVVGNGTLIYTVLMNKNMRNTPNVLLVSLALGDLLLIFISVPFSATYYTFHEWPFGESMCKLNEFLVTLSLGVSVFTLTALSGERYIVIVYPMASHSGPSTMRTVLIASTIWVVSTAMALLELFAARVQYPGSPVPVATCVLIPEEWGDWYGKFHAMFQFIVYFALPICVIATFYVLMARMLMISSKHLPGDGVKGQAAKQIEARKKVARLVLSFVIVFVICWLPRHIYLLWYYYDPGFYDMFWHVFKIIGFCLSFINSCVNPLALYFLSRQFRRYYNRYMFCSCCCRKGIREDQMHGTHNMSMLQNTRGVDLASNVQPHGTSQSTLQSIRMKKMNSSVTAGLTLHTVC